MSPRTICATFPARFGRASLLAELKQSLCSDDWSRLRDVLGEEEEDEDEDDGFALDGSPGTSPEDSLFGYPGSGEETEEAGQTMSGAWETGGQGPGGGVPPGVPGEP